MKKYNKIITCFFSISFSLFCIAACGVENVNSENINQEKPFFDLKGFVELEKERISKSSISFLKKVKVNDKSEEKEMDKIDVEQELKPFVDSDINRPTWSDKYKIDSVFNSAKKLEQLNYESMDEKLKTKSLSVLFEGNSVSKIIINNTSNSSVAETIQRLEYSPQNGFSIVNNQSVSMLDDKEFLIEILFQ